MRANGGSDCSRVRGEAAERVKPNPPIATAGPVCVCEWHYCEYPCAICEWSFSRHPFYCIGAWFRGLL